VALAATSAKDAEKREIEVKELQEELMNTKEELESLQKNYTDLQHLYMEPFVPNIETQIGAKVLWDSAAQKNYLWMTGEVYNRGLGIAFNTVLEITLYVANSTLPIVTLKSLGDINPYNYKTIRQPFYADAEIKRWEINVTCTITK
jgi:hypothetical protein